LALTSALVPLLTPAPSFSLPDVSGVMHDLMDFADEAVVVVAFVCNHCPYVRHIEAELGRLAEEGGALFLGICSNDADGYPEDSPDQLRAQAARAGWSFPYLVDVEQTAARDYGAVCTPDFFGYGPDRRLAYRGAFDNSTPSNGQPVNGSLLREAIALIARGETVPEPHRPSMGCSIKWRTDSHPA